MNVISKNGKKKIVMSRNEWETIGKIAKWNKSAGKGLSWNIEGMAEEVINSMKADNADISDVNDYISDIYYSVYSKEPDEASLVSEEVIQLVREKYENDCDDDDCDNDNDDGSSWNIEGMAQEVINSMKADNADISDVNDYMRDIYYSVYSREPSVASLVSERVKQLVRKKYDIVEAKSKTSKLTVAQDNKWNRFNEYIDRWTWDDLIETGEGNLSKEEERQIIDFDLYGKLVTKKSIEALNKGLRLNDELGLLYNGIDGKQFTSYKTKEEMKKEIENHLSGADIIDASEYNFRNEYGNFSLQGTTMSDLGIVLDHNRFR